MKKFGLLLIAALVVSLVLAGCGGGSSTLIMATEAGFAPYEYLDGDKVVGIDPDIAAEIAKEMGKTLKIQNMDFDSIPNAVAAGKADFGAAGMSITPERAEVVDFTIEYATSKQVIIVLKDSGIKTAEDLTGKTVAVQEGTVADLATADFIKDVQILPSKKYFEAVSNLTTGKAQAIVLDVLPAQEIIKTADNLVILDGELFTDRYAFCVKKGNTKLLETINKVMQRLIDEGKIDEYTMKHLGQ